MEYFVISAKFVPLKYYTLSSQLRRLTSFSVGLFGSANSVTRSYPVMRKSCIVQTSLKERWRDLRLLTSASATVYIWDNTETF